jgi:hypothetical protein
LFEIDSVKNHWSSAFGHISIAVNHVDFHD